MQRLKIIGLLYFILTVALLGKTLGDNIVEREYKQAEVSDVIHLYRDDFMSIDKYEIKDKEIDIKVLNLSWNIRFIKWNDIIYPLSYSEYGETGLSLFYTKEDAFIILDLPTQEVPRYDIVHIKDNTLKYIGYTEYNNERMFAKDSLLKQVQSVGDLDFKLKVKDNKPIFFYEKDGWVDVNDVIFENSSLEDQETYMVEYLASDGVIKKKFIFREKVKEYFENFDKYGTPYNQKYLSTEETKSIKKSNKSYQIYQELNKYDIFLMLVKTSDYVKSWGGKTTDLKHYHLIEADTSNGVVSSMIYLDKEARGFAKDEAASLGVIGSLKYNIKTKKLINPNNDYIGPIEDKFDKVWADIMDIYLFNKKRKYLFIKEKSILYKKPNLNSKSKKFLIKDDCALIVDEKDGWYQVFYYHPHWHTNTVMWIKFDAKKHGLIR